MRYNRRVFVVKTQVRGTPSVSVERKIDRFGAVSDTFVLNLIAQMMFIDLEHEFDHIDQVVKRFIAQGVPILTNVTEQTARGWRRNLEYPGLLRDWQNTITEYHVRLLEFRRLYQRNIDHDLLKLHAKHVAIWSRRYWK